MNWSIEPSADHRVVLELHSSPTRDNHSTKANKSDINFQLSIFSKIRVGNRVKKVTQAMVKLIEAE